MRQDLCGTEHSHVAKGKVTWNGRSVGERLQMYTIISKGGDINTLRKALPCPPPLPKTHTHTHTRTHAQMPREEAALWWGGVRVQFKWRQGGSSPLMGWSQSTVQMKTDVDSHHTPPANKVSNSCVWAKCVKPSVLSHYYQSGCCKVEINSPLAPKRPNL